MYPILNGSTFLVQQEVVRATFDGSEIGRASVTLTGGGVFVVRAKKVGTPANAYTVQVIDPGGTTAPPLSIAMVGAEIRITLARAGGVVTTRAQDVVDAVNACEIDGFPIVADLTTDDVMTAIAATPLTGGADPEIRHGGFQYLWTGTANHGLFYLEQDDVIFIRQFEAKMSGLAAPTLLQVLSVTLSPGLGVNTLSRECMIFEHPLTAAAPDIAFTDVRIPLVRGQALKVVCAAEGFVRVYANRAPFFPYV